MSTYNGRDKFWTEITRDIQVVITQLGNFNQELDNLGEDGNHLDINLDIEYLQMISEKIANYHTVETSITD